MKKTIITRICLFIAAMLFVGCAAVQVPKVNDVSSAGIGGAFFSHVEPLVSKYELTVSAASNSALSLLYNEYFFSQYNWMLKSGFNKSFDYNLAESKIVNFKSLSFEVLEVKDGTVHYRRIR